MTQPIPLSKWEQEGNTHPTTWGWRNMLRPGQMRDDLLKAGVVRRVNGRWLIFPDKWAAFCAAQPADDVA